MLLLNLVKVISSMLIYFPKQLLSRQSVVIILLNNNSLRMDIYLDNYLIL